MAFGDQVFPKGLPRSFWALFWGTLINRIGTGSLPLLSLYLTTKQGLSITQGSVVLTVSALGGLGGMLAGGSLSDRLGRRATMIASMLLVALCLLGLSAAQGDNALMAWALGMGFTGELYRPPSRALVADLVAPEHRVEAYGAIYWASNMGVAVASVLGGFLASHSYPALFAFDAGTSVVFAAILWKLVPETKPGPTGMVESGSLWTPFAHPVFAPVLLGVLLTFVVFFQFRVALPQVMTALGFSPFEFGLAIGANAAVIVVFQPLTVRWVQARLSLASGLATGALLVGAGFALYAVATSFVAITLAVVVWTLGEMVLVPASSEIANRLAPVHLRGRFHGAFGFAIASGMLVAPLYGALLMERVSTQALWLSCGLLGVVAAAIFLSVRRSLAAPAP